MPIQDNPTYHSSNPDTPCHPPLEILSPYCTLNHQPTQAAHGPGSTPRCRPGDFLVRIRTITMSPELWVASYWPAAAVIAPRGPPEGGRWSGQIGLSYPSKPGTRARQCRTPSRFWHVHALPRHHMLVQLQPRIPPLAPSWTPVDPISWQAAYRRPRESGLLPRLRPPRGRISTLGHVSYMYLYHIDPGESRERVISPPRARLCGLWAGCGTPGGTPENGYVSNEVSIIFPGLSPTLRGF